MVDVYNFDGYQVPHVGLTEDLGGVGDQANRAFASKMSNFGALRFGNRSATDYTMILNEESRVENPDIPTWATENDKNPYLPGSTRKRLRDEEFTVMGIGNRRSNDATNQPGLDVSDTNAAVDDGSNAPKRFPNEGWRTFGGRTTGHAYIPTGQTAV